MPLRTTRPNRARPASTAGVSLIEMAVGLGLLAALIVTVAGLLALAARQSAEARHETTMIWLARARLEQLQALALSIQRLPSGATVLLTDVVTDLSRDPPAVGGTGLLASPVDSLEQSRPGFEDHLDVRGRWIGTDAGAASRAAYVRRWAIRAERTAGVDMMVFDVVVATSARARRGAVTTLGPGVVRLSAAVARRAA